MGMRSKDEEEKANQQQKPDEDELAKKKAAAAKKRAAAKKKKAEKEKAEKARKLKEAEDAAADREADREDDVGEDPEILEDGEEVEVLDDEESDPVETAVVERKATPAPVQTGGRLVLALQCLENAFPTTDYGTLPRVVAKQGGFYDDDDENLGKEIEVTMHSYHKSWTVSPNSNQAPKKLCRFSIDNTNLTLPYEDEDEGVLNTTVKEHVAFLKSEGYKKAASKRYLIVTCTLEDAEEENDNIGGMVQLSLSPESVKMFERHQFQSTVKIKSGEISETEAMHVKCKAKVKNGEFTYTIFTFKQL